MSLETMVSARKENKLDEMGDCSRRLWFKLKGRSKLLNYSHIWKIGSIQQNKSRKVGRRVLGSSSKSHRCDYWLGSDQHVGRRSWGNIFFPPCWMDSIPELHFPAVSLWFWARWTTPMLDAVQNLFSCLCLSPLLARWVNCHFPVTFCNPVTYVFLLLLSSEQSPPLLSVQILSLKAIQESFG